MRFISCSFFFRRNLLRFFERIKYEYKELKRFFIILIFFLVLGLCFLYVYKCIYLILYILNNKLNLVGWCLYVCLKFYIGVTDNDVDQY